MSKLLKSKVLFGLMVVAIVFVGSVALAPEQADAQAGCTLSMTLRQGSVGSEVSCLQSKLGITADGKFGPMTKAAVMSFQASNGLVADGIVGAMTRAALSGTVGGGVSGLPAGCTSTSGYSSVTGESCASGGASLPAGCMPGYAFSSTTGAPCSGGVTLPAGCTSTAGFSVTTGVKCDSTSGGGSTPSGLQGGAGTATVTTTTVDTETDVAEGETQKVFGLRVEATGGDVQLTSMRVVLEKSAGETGSTWLNRYMSKVTIWEGTTQVGEVDVSEFTKSGTEYSATIPLTNAIVRQGSANREYFYVGLTALSNLDSADAGAGKGGWNVDVNNIRYTDSTGAILTDGTVRSLDDTIEFIKLSASGDVKVTATRASSSPEAQNVEVSDTGSTSDVPLLAFNLKAQGTDMSIDALKVVLTTSGATPTEEISQLAIYKGSQRLGEITSFGNSGASNTINLDETLVIEQGDTVALTVKAKVKQIGVGNFGQGDSIKADLGSLTGLLLDSSGNAVTNISGSALGEYQVFYSEGVNVSNFSSSVTTTTDSGVNVKQTYNISFDVTAFGNTYYIPKIVETRENDGTGTLEGDDTSGLSYEVETSAGVKATVANVASSASALTSNANTVSSYFEVPDGQTKTFSFTVELTRGNQAAFYHVQLVNLLYDLNQTAVGDDEAIYTFAPAQNFETSDRSLPAL